MRYSISYQSPLGWLNISCSEQGLEALEYANNPLPALEDIHSVLQQTMQQLDEYFAGDRTTFDIPLSLIGSDFQIRVWNELIKVPYGHTATYQDIANRIGNPGAVRAVGVANSKNPIPIIVPCHRIIGSDGKLTGYAGGLWRKEKLLKLEGALLI